MSSACDSSNASVVPTYITNKTNEGKEQSEKLQGAVELHFYISNKCFFSADRLLLRGF